MSTGYSDSEWSDLSTGAYAVYDDDPANADIYENFYNWYAIDLETGVCPIGWHVSTDEEIKELEVYLGMSQQEADNILWRGTDEGSKLAGNYDLWTSVYSANDLVNDSEFGISGFTALLGGFRNEYGSYSGMGYKS